MSTGVSLFEGVSLNIRPAHGYTNLSRNELIALAFLFIHCEEKDTDVFGPEVAEAEQHHNLRWTAASGFGNL